MLNRYSANVVVAKMMGPVALAHYTIGTYVEPIVSTLRNSLSDSMLPSLVQRSSNSRSDAVAFWRRGTVVASILLLPIAALLARYAETLIVTAFSPSYRGAVPVLQVFLIVLIRECFDFAVALKAINETRYFLYGDIAALVLNLILLSVLLPAVGLVGAVAAYVIASFVEGIYLGWWVTRLYGVPVRQFVPWADLAKVALSAVLALLVTYGTFWTEYFHIVGVVLAAGLYSVVYAALLRLFQVREALILMERLVQRLLSYVPAFRA
jgi:O-antigen/teichoic acid export membrane protein